MAALRSNKLFDVVIPKSPNIRLEIKIAIRQGGHLLVWEGPSDTEETQINNEVNENKAAGEFLKRSVKTGKVRSDGSGIFIVPIKMICTENGQTLEEFTSEMMITPGDGQAGNDSQSKNLIRFSKQSSKAVMKISRSIIKQQTDLPVQLKNMLTTVLHEGNKSVMQSAQSSADIVKLSAQSSADMMKAAIEPLKTSLSIIEKVYLNENIRADKAHGAVITLLNNKDKNKEESLIDDFIKLVGITPSLLSVFERIIDKVKKGAV